MEVAPRYWQSPETLKDVYVSTSGGAVGGTQATNAVGRHGDRGASTNAGVNDRGAIAADAAQPGAQFDR